MLDQRLRLLATTTTATTRAATAALAILGRFIGCADDGRSVGCFAGVGVAGIGCIARSVERGRLRITFVDHPRIQLARHATTLGAALTAGVRNRRGA